MEAQLAVKPTPFAVAKLQMYQDHIQANLAHQVGGCFATPDTTVEEAEERLMEAEYAMTVSSLQNDYKMHILYTNSVHLFGCKVNFSTVGVLIR